MLFFETSLINAEIRALSQTESLNETFMTKFLDTQGNDYISVKKVK